MATRKQKAVIQKIVENRGKSVSKAMIEVGYSPNTAKNPSNLTKSKSWEQLVSEIDWGHTMKRIGELVDAEAIITVKTKGKEGAESEVRIVKQDAYARSKGIDFQMKIAGKYAPSKVIIEDENDTLSDEELDKKLEELQGKVQARYNTSKAKVK